jgi:hypothetical protein
VPAGNGEARELVEWFMSWAEGEPGAVTVSVTAYADHEDASAFCGFKPVSVMLTRSNGVGEATPDSPSSQ